jgi:Skp family chaperone for outer membrane proteins
MRRSILGLVVVVLPLATAPPAAAQMARPPCRKVIGAVNREVAARHGRPASPYAVARELGAEPEWVQRCMQAYGRVPARVVPQSEEDKEVFERALEEGRPMQLDIDKAELRYQKQERQRVERKEQRERRRKLREEKEFDQSSDPFYPVPEY